MYIFTKGLADLSFSVEGRKRLKDIKRKAKQRKNSLLKQQENVINDLFEIEFASQAQKELDKLEVELVKINRIISDLVNLGV
jgi:hypothetical protein